MGKKTFLKNMHYFRAFAILNVVSVHLWRLPESYNNRAGYSLINSSRQVLFHDSTIYFLFISGFLFQYLSSNFNMIKYYWKKIQYVIFPFIFISTFMFFIKYFILKEASFSSFGEGFISIYLKGSMAVQLWYIPFISIIFLVSPFLLYIPQNKIKFILIFLILLPLFFSRTSTRITINQYLFFFPVYFLGFATSINYEKIIILCSKYKYLLILSSLFSSILILLSINNKINLHISIETIYYVQKISITFLMIILLKGIENKDIHFLSLLGDYSFPLYFTHTMVGDSLVRDYVYTHISFTNSVSLVLFSIIFVSFIIVLNLHLCIFVKVLFKNKSRMIFGY